MFRRIEPSTNTYNGSNIFIISGNNNNNEVNSHVAASSTTPDRQASQNARVAEAVETPLLNICEYCDQVSIHKAAIACDSCKGKMYRMAASVHGLTPEEVEDLLLTAERRNKITTAPPTVRTRVFRKGKNRGKVIPGLNCQACGAISTPEWRRGPSGKKDYCNACGLHYAKQLRWEKNVQVLTPGDSNVSSISNLLAQENPAEEPTTFWKPDSIASQDQIPEKPWNHDIREEEPVQEEEQNQVEELLVLRRELSSGPKKNVNRLKDQVSGSTSASSRSKKLRATDHSSLAVVTKLLVNELEVPPQELPEIVTPAGTIEWVFNR